MQKNDKIVNTNDFLHLKSKILTAVDLLIASSSAMVCSPVYCNKPSALQVLSLFPELTGREIRRWSEVFALVEIDESCRYQ